MVGELPLQSDSSPSSRTMDRSSSNAVLEFEIDEGWGAAEAEEESGEGDRASELPEKLNSVYRSDSCSSDGTGKGAGEGISRRPP